MRKHRKIHRLNLELGPKSFHALEKLQRALETSSQAETIRIALTTLSKLIDETQQGARVLIERNGEDKVELFLPLARAPRTNES